MCGANARAVGEWEGSGRWERDELEGRASLAREAGEGESATRAKRAKVWLVWCGQGWAIRGEANDEFATQRHEAVARGRRLAAARHDVTLQWPRPLVRTRFDLVSAASQRDVATPLPTAARLDRNFHGAFELILATSRSHRLSPSQEPYRYLFIYRHPVTATWGPIDDCPPEADWCPSNMRQRVALRLRNFWRGVMLWPSEVVAGVLTRIDPSMRLPKPKKPALATLAQTVGREVLVENRGRKAKISKKKRRVSYRRKNRDGFDVMDSGLF